MEALRLFLWQVLRAGRWRKALWLSAFQFFVWQALRARALERRAAWRGYALVASGNVLDSFPENEDLLWVAAHAQDLANDYGAPVKVRLNGRYVGTVYPGEEVVDEAAEA